MHRLIFQKVNIFLSQAKDYQETGIATQFFISCNNSTVVTQIKLQYFTRWYLPVCLDHIKCVCVCVCDKETLILQMWVYCWNTEGNNYNTTHVASDITHGHLCNKMYPFHCNIPEASKIQYSVFSQK
jgi:hypothetical protein